ncbi:MAG: outer membrane lipoprotein carrier protein LolA [Alphaproteobacteria bacterium]|nr:outer membrane lipoprotein carrier protein LolA [Alphaproteobacteria bacterium]
MNRRDALLGLPFLLWATPGLAAAARPSPLSATDQADIARIESYLNGIRTLQAGFLQASSDGSVARGRVFISRPGKLRFEYDPPVEGLLVSDGTWLIHYDAELKQANHLPLDLTPASFLLRDPAKLSGEVTVTRFQRGPNVLRVTLVRTTETSAGSVQLTFSDNPLALQQWIVTDAQGTETRLSLLDARLGQPLDPRLFVFDKPVIGPGQTPGSNR